MSRGNPAPWFRPSRNTFFVTLRGKQISLQTADKAEALSRWHELISQDETVAAPKPSISADRDDVLEAAKFLTRVLIRPKRQIDADVGSS